MSEAKAERWLEEGITAVKNGRRAEARILLLKVVEADDENESGWLWLSSVMDDEADRRTCLENVLELNPNNTAAKRTLAELDKAAAAPTGQPVNTAVSSGAPVIEYQQHETFDDVWSRNVPLCGYCAAGVQNEQDRCPRCQRSLLVKVYRYAEPSSNLVLFWFSLVVMACLFIVQVTYVAVAWPNPLSILSGLFTAVLLLGTAVAINYRQFWAFVLAYGLILLIIVSAITQLLITPDLTGLGFDSLDEALRGVVEPLTSGTWKVIKGAQLGMAMLTLLFAYLAGPDFERVQYRQIATATKGLHHGSEYHGAAQRLAKAGLWATAVMNWQRAVALEPTRITYQRHLGEAYARLGFYERSLDVLQNARHRTSHPDVQAELDTVVQKVQQSALASGSPSKTTAFPVTHG